MARITELQLRNVRCFKGKQSAKTNRITLLVGPNSSGKSTFLGCYKVLADMVNFQTSKGRDLEDDNYFDEPPFYMGDYSTLARSGAKEFTVSGQFEKHHYAGAAFTYKKGKNGDPLEKEVSISMEDEAESERELKMSRKTSRNSGKIREYLQFEGPNFEFEMDSPLLSYRQISTWISRMVRRGILPFDGSEKEYERITSKVLNPKRRDEFVKLNNFLKDLFSSESPTFLARPLEPAPDFRRNREYLRDALQSLSRIDAKIAQQIGVKTGIWKNISIEKGASDRDEIMVETPSGKRNLMDVGYGIYNLLPFANAMANAKKPTTFLLQQPEIHLHPESQAELAKWMVESKHSFIIETHSEHFTDRFRICINNNLLDPKDLTIVFFDHDEGITKLHNISVDKNGNLGDAPVNYGRFFLKESGRLLGFEKEF